MKQQALCLIAILSAASPLYAQEEKEWTLEDCINYALEKNIQLQQNKISLQESEIDVKSAKANLFPSLSFSTGHNMINRPYQEQSATVSGTEIITSVIRRPTTGTTVLMLNGRYGMAASD